MTKGDTLFSVFETPKRAKETGELAHLHVDRASADDEAQYLRDYANRHWPQRAIRYAVVEVTLLEDPS